MVLAAKACAGAYFNMEYINGLTYKPKDVVAPAEAFAYLEKITF